MYLWNSCWVEETSVCKYTSKSPPFLFNVWTSAVLIVQTIAFMLFHNYNISIHINFISGTGLTSLKKIISAMWWWWSFSLWYIIIVSSIIIVEILQPLVFEPLWILKHLDEAFEESLCIQFYALCSSKQCFSFSYLWWSFSESCNSSVSSHLPMYTCSTVRQWFVTREQEGWQSARGKLLHMRCGKMPDIVSLKYGPPWRLQYPWCSVRQERNQTSKDSFCWAYHSGRRWLKDHRQCMCGLLLLVYC